MSRKLTSVSLVATLMGGTAIADVPNVAADIAPVHSLVAKVMAGVGEPSLVIPAGASPHEYNLRPSEAAALQNADLVFWIGEDLTPWLGDAVGTLASNATVTELLEADGTVLLDFRENALFEAHDHGDHDDHDDHDHDKDHADHDDHDHDEDHEKHDDDHAEHDDHDDHADHDGHDEHDDHDHEDHEDHAKHEDHDDHADHDDHEDHAHGDHDPHAWLSPENAGIWLNQIAAQLSAADPDNAGTYYSNAAAAREELAELTSELAATLERVSGGRFIVFHDAYQYFEDAFDFPASGAISIADASDPSPARVAEIQGRIKEEGIDCVLAEPQFNPGLIDTVLEGTPAKVGVIDPLGAELESGSDLYNQLLRNMAETLAECL